MGSTVSTNSLLMAEVAITLHHPTVALYHIQHSSALLCRRYVRYMYTKGFEFEALIPFNTI